MSEVSSENTPKKRRHRKPDDLAKKSARNLRHRIKNQRKKNPHAVLFSECRECGASIKPSYKRGFCANDGKCRDAFFKNVQVTRIVPIVQKKSVAEIIRENRLLPSAVSSIEIQKRDLAQIEKVTTIRQIELRRRQLLFAPREVTA